MLKKIALVMIVIVMAVMGTNLAAAQEGGDGEGGPEGGRGGREDRQIGLILDIVTDATGLTRAEVLEMLGEDMTLAEIISANGGDVATVQADIVAALEENITVSTEERLANLETRVEELLNADMPGFEGGERGERSGRDGERGVPGFFGGLTDEVATQTGQTAEEIREAVDGGATLNDILSAAGVDPQAVIDAVVARAEENLAEEVAEGELTQEEADARLADLTERLPELMSTTLAEAQAARRLEGFARRGLIDATSEALATTPRDLRDAVEDGQTLADYITANGGDVAAVSAAALTSIEEDLAEQVTDGRLTQEEADAILAEAPAQIEEMLSTAFEFDRRGPGGRGGRP